MENFKKENVQYFLDMDLAELSEGTPLSEGNGVTEFQVEAEAVAAALKKAGVPAGRVGSFIYLKYWMPAERDPFHPRPAHQWKRPQME